MKAAFYNGNQTITVGECTPVSPEAGQVQLKISHCGICGTDLHVYHGAMDKRVHLPQIMGHETAGTVAALGAGRRRLTQAIEADPTNEAVKRQCCSFYEMGMEICSKFEKLHAQLEDSADRN